VAVSWFWALLAVALPIGLRSAIEPAIAVSQGPVGVADWAQAQSVFGFFFSMAAAGLAPGLVTVLACENDAALRRAWLRRGALLGLTLSLCWVVPGLLAASTTHAGVGLLRPVARDSGSAVFGVAIAAGISSLAWAVLSAHAQALQRPRLLTLQTLIVWGPLVLLAHFAAFGVDRLVETQFLLGVLGVTVLAWVLSGPTRPLPAGGQRLLLGYLFTGMVIALASPATTWLLREHLLQVLGATPTGQLTAWLRVVETISLVGNGLIALLLLPRLARADSPTGHWVLWRFGLLRLIAPTCVVLLFALLLRDGVWSTFFTPEFAFDTRAVAWLTFGEMLRLVAWLGFYALLARRAMLWVLVGELLSVPLWAAWVWTLKTPDVLGVAQGYAFAYACYSVFNGGVVWWLVRRPARR